MREERERGEKMFPPLCVLEYCDYFLNGYCTGYTHTFRECIIIYSLYITTMHPLLSWNITLLLWVFYFPLLTVESFTNVKVHRNFRTTDSSTTTTTTTNPTSNTVTTTPNSSSSTQSQRPNSTLYNDKMQRPILDTLASFLFQLETNRVKASSQMDDKGRFGEPMEWSQDSSLANRFSQIMADKGYFFKQWVADIVAGEYNREETLQFIQTFVSSEPVIMFSFTTCPFCRRAKDLLEEKQISYKVLELDELEDNRGNEIRSMLGIMTKRTSVPSIFIHGKPIGGLNDGMPGLQILSRTGALDRILAKEPMDTK